MGWSNIHLHHFIIHGKQYGVNQPGGTMFNDSACEVKLASLGLRVKEKILYEYDFSICPSMGAWRYWWRHQIRVEEIVPQNLLSSDPVCIAGNGFCPPENCGGPWGFMKAKQKYSIWHIFESFGSMPEDEDFPEYKEELCELYPWLLVYLNRFDRQEVNQRLQQYVAGDKEMLFKQRIM
jgi:hypothetical protein